MKPVFNLIDDPWIPCIEPDGRVVNMGLRQALDCAPNLRGIQGDSPLVTAALYRLLLAVLHSALRGPQNQSEWLRIWEAGAWEAPQLDEYFHRWRDRFYLFHPRYPFFQSPDERVKPKSVTLLIHSMVVSDTLFDHQSADKTVVFSSAKSARILVAAQSFGVGGSCDPSQKLYFSDGTCARGILFLLEGETLFETLCLNLLRYRVGNTGRIPTTPEDRPAWEMADPFQPDRETPLGYLDYLTWQNRHIFLIPEQLGAETVVREVTTSPGLRLASGVLDPMKHYKQDKKEGYRYWFFSEGRSLWRDSSALFHLQTPGNYPPENFGWVSHLVGEECLESARTYRFMALGMATVPGQAKVEFYRQEHMPLPLAYFKNDSWVEDLSRVLEWAEKVNSHLWRAAGALALLMISPSINVTDRSKEWKDVWKDVKKGTKEQVRYLQDHWGVERNYWSGLETPFLSLVERIPRDSAAAIDDWQKTLEKSAWSAFRSAERLAGSSPAALKAAVSAGNQLARGLNRLFKGQEEVKNE